MWALANLGWEQQQDNYFRNELIEAVRIIDLGHVSEAGKLTGSWDGGLGQCQFMPSNFHAYAVDKDGDGRADIWDSLPDVFASMGNFIRTYCEWDPRVRSAGFGDRGLGGGLARGRHRGVLGRAETRGPPNFFCGTA